MLQEGGSKQPNAGDSAKRACCPPTTQIHNTIMLEIIDNNKYTIIATQFQYGQLIKTIEKENVRSECEKLHKLYQWSAKNNDNKTYSRIEVVNNETGEIREYWNSEENQIQF